MELDDRLVSLTQELEQLRRQERLMVEVRGQLARERARLAELKRTLDAEERDVTSLEGVSLSNLFHTMLGDKDARLEQERQEFLRAKLKHDEAAYAVAQLESELAGLQAKLQRLPELESQYADMINQKEVGLLQSEGSADLKAAHERLAALNRERTELTEALAAGQSAALSLAAVRKSLESAAGWGVWDMMGGGLLSTMAKHSHMDQAKEHAHQAEQALRRFHRELQDVQAQLDLHLQLDGFLRFADYFFDGLIVDWSVQSRINSSRQAVGQAEQRVSEMVARLEARLRAAEESVQQTNRERENLVARR